MVFGVEGSGSRGAKDYSINHYSRINIAVISPSTSSQDDPDTVIRGLTSHAKISPIPHQ
jgi:hypothetical protein